MKNWLTEKIHSQGQLYRAGDLVKVATGSSLTSQPFLYYLGKKFGVLYGF